MPRTCFQCNGFSKCILSTAADLENTVSEYVGFYQTTLMHTL